MSIHETTSAPLTIQCGPPTHVFLGGARCQCGAHEVMAATSFVQPAAPFTPDDAFGLLRSYSRHIAFVRLALTVVGQELERRGLAHDASKMLDDEFAGFARINAAARINKFGSPEYSASMDRERPTIDQHFARNTHHPEYFACFDAGGAEMGFLDVIEMVCDWWGARKGYSDARPWLESVELNFKSKGQYLNAGQLWLARGVARFLDESAPK